MRKSIINVFAMLLVAGVAFVSCSKESSEIESPSKGYKVSIPAKKTSSKAVADGGTATFKTTENVYVCNTSNGNAIDANVLHPSANAASANFDGTLAGTYAEGNNLKILYNTNASGVADYSSQNGTLAGVVDAGVASVSVTDISGGTITTGTATIDNLQSIFKFTFKNGSTTLNVKSVTISSAGNKLQTQYDVVNETATFSYLTVSNGTAQSTVYAALRFTPTADDPITFLVTDENGVQYLGHKNAPSTGFDVGKFYTSTIDVTPIAFSVASGTTVVFSPGNLVKTDATHTVESGNATYEFETVPFNTNGGSLGYGQGTPTATSARGYFTWNEIATADETPRTFTVNGSPGWRTLTRSEWIYLLKTRIIIGGAERYYLVDLGDQEEQVGLLIAPDDATLEDANELNPTVLTSNVNISNYTSKGFVFLPAIGSYDEDYDWDGAGWTAYYWTTTYTGFYTDYYVLNFNTTSVSLEDDEHVDTDLNYHLPVRLVHD